jgi:hypothetical protein
MARIKEAASSIKKSISMRLLKMTNDSVSTTSDDDEICEEFRM